MAEDSVFTCPECGKEIRERGKFCPYCAAPLPQKEQDSSIGYWNFYGAISEEPPAAYQGPTARGILRFLAGVLLVGSLICGFATSNANWGFNVNKAWRVWAFGGGAAVLLFLVSFLTKPKEK